MRLSQCTVMGGMFLGMCVGAAASREAQALINIQLRPVTQTVTVGSSVSVGIYAVSDNTSTQLLSALQMIFTWDTSKLQLTGSSAVAPLSFQGFLMGPDGINEANPPADGNAIIYALDNPGSPIGATPLGTQIATLQFNALALAVLTPINILAAAGQAPNTEMTAVFDGNMPNQMVTGSFTGGTVTIVALPTPGAGALFFVGALAAGRRRRK